MRQRTVPTIGELLGAYPQIAEIERMKSERPCVTTVCNVVSGVRKLVESVGLGHDAAVTDLTRQKLDLFLAGAKERGQSPTTAWTYVFRLRGLVARWTLPYYEERGWRVGAFQIPSFRRRVNRYVRPERDVLLRIRDWYESLAIREDRREWMVATLMLEFAMRNGDITRLKWSNFREDGDGVRLCYVPHKTELTSGRIVTWPVHPDLWQEICRAHACLGERIGTHFQGLVVPAAKEVFPRLNREIREGHYFTKGSKALYELRKICVDHVYQRFGAEAASSISGDDIRTVTRYYADPSCPNVGRVKIVDLI